VRRKEARKGNERTRSAILALHPPRRLGDVLVRADVTSDGSHNLEVVVLDDGSHRLDDCARREEENIGGSVRHSKRDAGLAAESRSSLKAARPTAQCDLQSDER
jgi:hypothetical protein